MGTLNHTADLVTDGFAGPFDLPVSRQEIRKIADYLDDFLSTRRVHPIYGRYSTRDWHLVHPPIVDLLGHDRVVRELDQVLGEHILLWRSKVFSKAAGEGPLGWHQEWGAFNGEEIGNDRPALIPKERNDTIWNLTVWMALGDVTADMGPLRFARGSNRHRYPIRMMPIEESEFYVDPFDAIGTVDELISAVRTNTLILDIDTAHYFDGVDVDRLDLKTARDIVHGKLRGERGAATLDFDENEHEIVSMTMPAGSFVVFSERVMHGSSGNISPRRRLAINARYTRGDTLIYPYHNSQSPIDGSNLDVSRHWSIPVAGSQFHPDNVIRMHGSQTRAD